MTPSETPTTATKKTRKKAAKKKTAQSAAGAAMSGKNLVVVESPAKARTIEKYLGKDFKVVASVGHVIDLPKSKLGVDVEHDFTPEYSVIKGKATIINDIKKMASGAEAVYLAPDPDREGEAIAYHLNSKLADVNNNIHRATFNEITRDAVLEAIAHPRQINESLFNAQQARRVLDRIVGFKVSQLLWQKISWGLSAGRVQSVALRMICEREAEREAFIPEEYWTVEGIAEADAPPPFAIRLDKIDGDKAVIPNQAANDTIMSDLSGAAFVIEKIEKKDARKRPFAPFTTSTLQQEASRRLRMTARRTMALAQQLYEGIDLGGEMGSVGLITYMRTDSTRLSGTAVGTIRNYIDQQFTPRNRDGFEYLPESPRVYSRKAAAAQDAHEAIRPTDVRLTPQRVASKLDKDQLRLYELIWKRAVASQMADAVMERTRVEIPVGRYLFVATGSVQKFDGFMALYQEARDEAGKSESDNDNGNDANASGEGQTLPRMEEGQTLKIQSLDGSQHFTQPPGRFTEAALIRELEKQGIGRPSTYAQIISVIQDRKYVTKERGSFRPEDLGKVVNDWLIKNFPDFMEIQFTAEMENKLDHVEEGKADWVALMHDFYGPFSRRLGEAEEKERWKVETEIPCERCGKPMDVRMGRNGLYLSCSDYPDCKGSGPVAVDEHGKYIRAPEEQTDEKCLKCGSPMRVMNGRYGRFLACTNEDCKATRSYPIGVPCGDPKCTGQLVEKRSMRGTTFYGCDQYPNCRFTVFEEPYREHCDETGKEEWFCGQDKKKMILCCEGDLEVSIKKAHENQYVPRKKTTKKAAKGAKKSAKKSTKKAAKKKAG